MQKELLAVKDYLLQFQLELSQRLESEDQTSFRDEHWEHQEGGGGSSRLLTQGVYIEKAGVNFSHVFGKSLPSSATQNRPELIGVPFEAMGVSVVVHPLNPYVPTTHANLRFFTAKNGRWWFGGGFDLTPYYGFVEDCQHWHLEAKKACDPFGLDVYPQFKKGCDDYFYLSHRNEQRGIGGLFFDDLQEWGFERTFEFIQSVGQHFMSAYLPILSKRKKIPFSERERQFQLYRRGRYVEFNLLYDRGTLFGLQSKGRVESILMSLPPLVSWLPYHNEDEEKLISQFLIKKNWIPT